MQKQKVKASNLILADFLTSNSALLDLTLILTQISGCTGVHIMTLWSRRCPVTQNSTVLMRVSEKRSFYQSNSRAIVSASHLWLYRPRPAGSIQVSGVQALATVPLSEAVDVRMDSSWYNTTRRHLVSLMHCWWALGVAVPSFSVSTNKGVFFMSTSRGCHELSPCGA